MFTKNNQNAVSAIGEQALIQRINSWLQSVTLPPPQGIGDDCAVIHHKTAGSQIITTDSLTYGQHFDASVCAQDAGSKLIKRNLSDIAAMGGAPDHAVLALLCGPDLAIDWLEAFFCGIRACCETYAVKIVGGDVSGLAPGHFSAVLTLIGSVETTKLRTGAAIGDWIYVTGSLGGSILEKHIHFTPRLKEGQWLAKQPDCSALMDLTDGLAKDLEALLPHQSCARIDIQQIPIAEDALKRANSSGRMPMEHAFCDGEDYELLFTINASSSPADFARRWQHSFPHLRLSLIGQLAEASDKGATYIDQASNEALPWVHGFEHLKE